MFSGIGGFELGIEKAIRFNESLLERCKDSRNIKRRRRYCKPHCVGFSEIDKYSIQTYTKHFPTHKNYGDAFKINPTDLPDFEMLCGGFPCQSFSIAGKRKGFQDIRGTLFHEICRILQSKRPGLVFLENVKGLLSADNGRCFATILTSLDELGYDVEWQVLNSKHFGVPQNRERVFIIGHLRGTGGRQIFPIRENDKIIDDTTPKFQREISTEETANCLTGRYYKMAPTDTYISYARRDKSQHSRVYNTHGISPTLAGDCTPKITIPVLTPDRLEKRQNGRRFKEDGEEMFTLNTQDKHGIYDGKTIRRLTPTECERLQGYPDGWTEGVSDTQRYKQLGNAVTVNVIEAIARRL